MSLGYAEKLSFKEDVGVVGMPELYDSPDILQAKIEELATFIQQSKHLVAFTGAGISTSCGIPDFRGPHGIWTLQREGKPLPKADVPFHRAVPGLTHMALAALEKAGILKFVISQNIDGLHLRSDLPRDKLAELHGNSFREVCSSCRKEYIRDFEVETIGLKETGRRCCESNCRGKLIDTVLDWEDALPPKEMAAAEKHCKIADLFLCLGTSLQITPACNLPLKSIRAGGKLVIVNLQPTPKDKKAALLIHAHVDKVIRAVMQILNLSIPPHVQVDHVQISLTYLSKRKQHMKWRLKVLSTHGDKVPLPFLKLVEISFPDRSDLKPAFLKEQPFSLIRGNLRTNPLRTLVKLIFGDGVGCSSVSVEYPIDFQKNVEYFDHGKDTVIKNLRCKAIEESSCGHVSPIQQRFSSGLNGVITDYAIVTGFMKYETTLMIDFKCQKENGGTNKRCLQDIDDAEICIASKKAKEF